MDWMLSRQRGQGGSTMVIAHFLPVGRWTYYRHAWIVREVVDTTFTLNTVFTTAYSTYSQYKVGINCFVGIVSFLSFLLK